MLSGFLLSSILLKQIEANIPTGEVVRGFFAKRIFRLFPAYLLLLIGLLVLQELTGFYTWEPGKGVYYFTYTANFYFFFEGYQSASLNHVWSLCVEEQFYLILPFFMLLVPKRWVVGVLSLVIMIVPFLLMRWPDQIHRVMVYGNLATLGGGVILGYLAHAQHAFIELFRKNWVVVAALLLSVGSGMYMNDNIHSLVVGVFLAIIVFRSFEASTGFFTPILSSSVFIWIGKLSYGIYLFHRFIPFFLKAVYNDLNIQIPVAMEFASYFIVLIILTVSSFFLVERPFLRMKKRFDY